MYKSSKLEEIRTISFLKKEFGKDVTIKHPYQIHIGRVFYKGSVGISPGYEDRGSSIYKCDAYIEIVHRWMDGSYKGTSRIAYFFIGNTLYKAKEDYRDSIGCNDRVRLLK